MNTELSVSGHTGYVGTLPALVRTRGGASFDPHEDTWAYRDGVLDISLKFGTLTGLSGGVVLALKSTLVWYAENRSPDHLVNLFTRMQHFSHFLRTKLEARFTSISSTELISYRSSLGDAHQWYLGSLRGLLKKWHGLGYAGVTDDAVLFLDQVRLKGNLKGAAVLTMDSRKGRLPKSK